jgi:hypothetical protein
MLSFAPLAAERGALARTSAAFWSRVEASALERAAEILSRRV